MSSRISYLTSHTFTSNTSRSNLIYSAILLPKMYVWSGKFCLALGWRHQVANISCAGQGIPSNQRRSQEARRSLRVHHVRMLLHLLPLVLVELGGISWSRHPAPVIPLAGRFSRRAPPSAQDQPRKLYESLPLSHNIKLHTGVSQGAKPGKGNCGN